MPFRVLTSARSPKVEPESMTADIVSLTHFFLSLSVFYSLIKPPTFRRRQEVGARLLIYLWNVTGPRLISLSASGRVMFQSEGTESGQLEQAEGVSTLKVYGDGKEC